MEALAQVFGGLGIFLLGVKGLSGPLASLAGPRVRAMMARGTRGSLQAGALGFGMGVLTQSSQAVTFIIASMRAAELIGPRRALPMLAWANVGTAGLVLVATLDLRLVALWLLGVIGMGMIFQDRGEGRWRPFLAAGGSLGFMLLGLGLLKLGAVPLREEPWAQALLAMAAGLWLPAFVFGALATMVVQSSSTVAILAITCKAAGLISQDQAVAAIYGASLGSGLAVWLIAGRLEGSARQPGLYQAMLRALGALLFLGLLLLERELNVPLVIAWAGWVTASPDLQLAVIFLLLQISVALLVAPLNRPMERWLSRLAPPSAREALARPRYLYARAVEDPPSALALAEAEQGRLLERLPTILDPVRAEAAAGPSDAVATAALEAAIGRFLSALLRQELSDDVLREAVRLRERLGLITTLRHTLEDFVTALAEVTPIPGPVAAMIEALHLITEELHAMRDAEAAAWIVEIAADRGEMMRGLRRNAAGTTDERLFLLTGLFERSVWLARRLALLEAERV